MQTEQLASDTQGLTRAAEILSAGGLIAFPTETVYGLGGDARSDHAVARIFNAKGRPRFNPLIVHVPDLAAARRYALFNTRAEVLAATFWPGPLTLVLTLRDDAGLSPLVTAGLTTIAIRIPKHPLARVLLTTFNGPLAAPSANPSGKVSPTCASHVAEGLDGKIEAILNGGPCTVGIESTIISLDDTPTLLRPGGIPTEAIETALGQPLTINSNTTKPNAPGQLASHYAPNAPVRLNVTNPTNGETWVGFGPCTGATLNLSQNANLIEAAANLFDTLRRADQLAGPQGRIAFAPIPETGLGRAINDRLNRAAAPRLQPT